MPKTLTSPVKKFSGTISIAYPLNYSQVIEIERAQRGAILLNEKYKLHEGTDNAPTGAEYWQAMIPAILACVDEWNIDSDNFPDEPTVENFPATPRVSASKFLSWLWASVNNAYSDEGFSELPND